MMGSRQDLIDLIAELEAENAEQHATILKQSAIIDSVHKMTGMDDIKRPLEPPVIVEE